MKNIICLFLLLSYLSQVEGQHTLKIATGQHLKISGATTLILHNTQFINNGSFDAATGSVIIKGNANNQQASIGGTSNTVFYNLKIDKTANGAKLTNSLQVDNQLDMTSGNLDLNGNNLTLGSANGQILNESSSSYIHGSNGGFVQKTQDLNNPNGINAGNIGVAITSTANFGSTLIKRSHTAQNVDGVNGILRYYNVTPTTNTGLNATVRLSYLDHELNSIAEADLEPFRYNGNSWDYYDVNSADVATNYVEATGLNSMDSLTLAGSRIKLMPKVMFQGPYAGGQMNDLLRSKNLLPTNEPFTNLGFTQVGGGGETIDPAVLAVTGNDAIVDWVFLELRDKNNPTTVLRTRSGLIQKDGDIVDLNGISPISFPGVSADDYYVAVRHRNHLGIRTSTAMSISSLASAIDYTDPSTAIHGTNSRADLGNNTMGLWAGNTSGDAMVRATGPPFINDYSKLLSYLGSQTNIVFDTYTREDVNMDGNVRAVGPPAINDYSKLLNVLGTVTNIIFESL